MPVFRKHSDEQFIEAVTKSTSIREVLKRLNLREAGGNYKEFKKRVERLRIDISHFQGQGHGKAPRKGRALSEILVQQSTYTNNNRLRIRLIREGVLSPRCGECGLAEWRGRAITLHLDHINGINNDHRLENLRLLCPNCHSQTDTYCGRNKRKGENARLAP